MTEVDAGPRLTDQPARDRIATDLDATLFVEAGAGSGKTRSLVDRVVALVDHGVAMRHIAAITFTERAAAELRDRIRTRLERRRDDPTGDTVARERAQVALDDLDAAAVSTLHAFAQRVLAENPIEAQLPPRFEVLDEVASEIEFEDRWRRFRDQLLDDPELERSLLLAFAVDVRLEDIRRLAAEFGRNWDRLADPRRVPWEATDPPQLALDSLLAQFDALLARRNECSDGGDTLCDYLDTEVAPYVEQLRAAPDEYERLWLLRREKPTLRCRNRGAKANWDDKPSILADIDAVRDARDDLAEQVAVSALQRLAVEVARFTREAAQARRASGRLEFHDLLVLARDLLRGSDGPRVRQRLRQRYQRLLLDEFQDTDPIQIELAALIASGQEHAGEQPWVDIDTDPGRLFFVGDPKQSIYRFRRADIALYLTARERFGQRLALTTNFRSAPGVVAWVNAVFSRLITAEPDSQPEYQPIDPAPDRGDPPVGPGVAALGVKAHDDDPAAEPLREREATDVAAATEEALGWQVSERDREGVERWRPARLDDVAILVPARTSLPALERALDQRGIPYRAETSSLVYTTREVRDLLTAARAAVDPTDQLALVAALRSPVFGCGDDDLFAYKRQHAGAWHIHAPEPQGLGADTPVVSAMRFLRRLNQDLPWLAPSELLGRIARERRLFELGYAQGRPRDLWRRLRFVIDQARAWSEAEGGTAREYLEWARLQASDNARVVETVLPESDDESVRILTIHGSKGLEFPITILSGMTTASRGMNTRVEVAFPDDGPVAIKVGKGLVTPEFEAYEPIDEQMSYHERLRLLYVACTRAQDHLVVSLHRKTRRNEPDEERKLTNAELLARASTDLDMPVLSGAASPARLEPAAPSDALPQLDAWEDERSQALASSRWRRSIGASDVAVLRDELTVSDALPTASDASRTATDGVAGAHDETAAGGDKRPRDLELPAWQKGRYGSAIGRAVHGVLQTVDLATGEPLDETVAAQAAAEGVIGRETDIARLVRAALSSEVLAESLTRPRWRETYVATPVGERMLEGYIDLLFRTAEGLVVVDYKTASSSADLEARMDAYRSQGAAYALAVAGATGEHVARVVFLFLTADGAVELDLDGLETATAELEDALRSRGTSA